MSRAFSRSAIIGCRTALRATPLITVSYLSLRTSVLKCDQGPESKLLTSTTLQNRKPHAIVSQRTISQLASGSFAGFSTGLIVSLFAPSIVFLTGLLGVALIVASRFGINATHLLGKISKGLVTSQTRFLGHMDENIVFKLSFSTTLILAAFVSF